MTVEDLMEFKFGEVVYHKLNSELHKGMVVGVYFKGTGQFFYEIMWQDLVLGTHCVNELTNEQFYQG